jgi:hypothetical protein
LDVIKGSMQNSNSGIQLTDLFLKNGARSNLIPQIKS